MFGRKPSSEATTTPAATATAVKPSAAGAPASPAAKDAEGFVDELESLWKPESGPARKSVEQLLLERGHVTEEQLTQAKTVQSQTPGKSLTQILLTMNASSEAQILSALAETLGLEFETPDKPHVDQAA